MDDDVLFETRGAVGLITLNRPKALNALNLSMVRKLDTRLRAWQRDGAIGAVIIQGMGERAFCAGGDIKSVVMAGQGPDALALRRDFFREEYVLNHLIGRYPKPYMAMLDGVTMGGGLGLSAHGAYRITTERTLIAMPETGIGLFPDVGATCFLDRAPGSLGLYMGLTGARLHAADTLFVGIGTHHVPSARLSALIDRIAAEPGKTGIAAALAELGADPGPAELPGRQAAIDRIFDAPSVETIVSRLVGESAEWAVAAAKALATGSPTSIKLTFRQLVQGRGLDLAQALVIEYRLSQHCMAGHDFFEGVRALLIDRDNAPDWSPAILGAVNEAMIDGYFAPLGAADLVLD